MGQVANLELKTRISNARQLRNLQDFEEFNSLMKETLNKGDNIEVLEYLFLFVCDKVGDLTYDWVMLDLISNIEAFIIEGEAFVKILLESSVNMFPHAQQYLSSFLLSLLYNDNHFEFLKQELTKHTLSKEVLEIVIPIFEQYEKEGNLRAQDVVRMLISM
jgi:hypothetical protein